MPHDAQQDVAVLVRADQVHLVAGQGELPASLLVLEAPDLPGLGMHHHYPMVLGGGDDVAVAFRERLQAVGDEVGVLGVEMGQELSLGRQADEPVAQGGDPDTVLTVDEEVGGICLYVEGLSVHFAGIEMHDPYSVRAYHTEQGAVVEQAEALHPGREGQLGQLGEGVLLLVVVVDGVSVAQQESVAPDAGREGLHVLSFLVGDGVELVVLGVQTCHTAHCEHPQVVIGVFQHVVDVVAWDGVRVGLVRKVFLQRGAVVAAQSGAGADPQVAPAVFGDGVQQRGELLVGVLGNLVEGEVLRGGGQGVHEAQEHRQQVPAAHISVGYPCDYR